MIEAKCKNYKNITFIINLNIIKKIVNCVKISFAVFLTLVSSKKTLSTESGEILTSIYVLFLYIVFAERFFSILYLLSEQFFM